MPLWKWTVEPVYLSRGLNGKKCDLDDVLDATCHRTLVSTLQQLTCLLKLAHYVFTEIGEECESVQKKTESLRQRVEKCEVSSQTLNPRSVSVPVGNIDWYCQVKDHYITTYVQESALIVSSNRPIFLTQLYEQATATPLPLIRAIDKYRNDGIRGSKIFARTPVLTEVAKRNKNLDIETRRPASFALARDWDEEEITFLKNECLGTCPFLAPSRDAFSDLDRLPSPEERTVANAMEYPSTMVPIDVTESSFRRMSSLRRSLLHVDFFIKRKKQKKNKRRNTISGNTSKELEEALKATSSKAPCLVDTSCQTDECSETSWLGKIFNKRNSLIKKEKKSPQEENNNNVLSKLAATVRNRDSVSLFDTFESNKSGKKSERNSIVIKDKNDNGTVKKATITGNKSKGKGILPISTLSAAMTVAVKMRQSKKSGDDGRSSSGNWSATSSTRVSVDSDQQHATSSSNGACSPSQSSLGKDSVLSDYTPQDTDTSRSQEGGRIGRSTERRQASVISSKRFDEDSTQTWLRSLEQECQSGTLTPENCPSDSTSTPHVLSPYIRRRRYHQNESSPPIIDDEGSSVYSVDTDGYYTSMHTDSGLKTRTPQHESTSRGRRDSGSSVSTLGNMSVNSLLSRATIGRSSKSDSFREERKIPPLPPVRTSSVKRDSGSDASSSQNGNGDTSTSESSDRDTVERLRQKTAINSSRYPSMCAVSPEPSDDESSKPKADDSIQNKGPPTFNMYSDQSPQNSKFTSLFCRNHPEKPVSEQNHSLVTSFSLDCPEEPSYSHRTETKCKEASPVPSITSTVFTEEGKSTVKRVLIPNPASKFANQSKSCSLIPKAVDRPVARVTLDPNGRVIYASNSLGRRRDGQAVRTLPSPIHEQKFATLPMRRAHCQPSAPVVAHNGKFVRIEALRQPLGMKTLTPNKETESKPCLEKVTHCISNEEKKNEPNKALIYGYRRTACGPRLPMNGYKPISVMQKESSVNSIGKDEKCNNSPPNGHIPAVPPQMPPLSRFSNQRCISGSTESSAVGYSYKGIGSQHVPSSLSVQNSLRSIASYSPYQSPIYGGVPNVHSSSSPCTQSSTPASKLSPRPSVLFPHSKTSPSLSSSLSPSRLSPRLSSVASCQPNCSTPQKQVSFHPSSLNPGRPLQNGVSSRASPPSSMCSSFSSPSLSTSKSSVLLNANSSNNSVQSALSPNRPNGISSHSLNNHSFSKPLFGYQNAFQHNGPTGQTNSSKSDFSSSNGVISHSKFQPSVNSSPSFQRISPSQLSRSLSPTSSTVSDRFQTIATPPPSSGDPEKKTITTADLFALIHNSKKKHNIKTDLDVSSSSVSSRSSSPSCSSVSSGKSVLAETGFLSPRNQINAPKDRRSWMGDIRASSLPPSDKRSSLANDRLGPAKPTSMYDFKMLLLQANRSTNDSPGFRMSAAERLRVQPREDDSPRSLPTSPVRTPVPIITGHSTVPIKRGSKSRSSIRYDLMYQPILEDCCEESEAQKSPKTPPCRTPLETSFINSTSSSANHLPPPQHWTQDFVPIRVASSRGASTWV